MSVSYCVPLLLLKIVENGKSIKSEIPQMNEPAHFVNARLPLFSFTSEFLNVQETKKKKRKTELFLKKKTQVLFYKGHKILV